MSRAFLVGIVAAPFVLIAVALLLAYWWVVAWVIAAVVAVGIYAGFVDRAAWKSVMADNEQRRVAAELSRLWTERTEPAPPVLPPGSSDTPIAEIPFTDAHVDLARHRPLRARFDGWRYRSPKPRVAADAPPLR